MHISWFLDHKRSQHVMFQRVHARAETLGMALPLLLGEVQSRYSYIRGHKVWTGNTFLKENIEERSLKG